MMLVYMDIKYHDRSFIWYAAKSLTMPTAMFHVAKVRQDNSVTADSGGAATAIEVTDGLRASAGVIKSSSVVLVIDVVFTLTL